MRSILSAARQQGFEIIRYSDFRLEGRRGEYSLQFQRGVHAPLSHLKIGRATGETLLCEAFYSGEREERVAARILALPLASP